jgi:hypothetical protein
MMFSYEKLKSKIQNEILLELITIIENILKKSFIYKIIAIILTSSVIGTLFYAFGYVFLYGYYFSGEISFSPSALQAFVLPVPFNFYSVIIISAYIFISSILLALLGRLFLFLSSKNIKWKDKFIFGLGSLSFFIIFHVMFSLFFVNLSINDFSNIISFLWIWVVPLIFVTSMLWFVRSIKVPVPSISGLIYGLILIPLIIELISKIVLNQDELQLTNEILDTFWVYFSFVFSAFYSLLDKYHYMKSIKGTIVRFLTYFPLLTLFLYAIYKILDYFKISSNMPILLVFLILLIPMLFIAAKFPWKKNPNAKDTKNEKDTKHDQHNTTLNNLNKIIYPTYGLFILLMSITAIYFGTLHAGKYLREFSQGHVFYKLEFTTSEAESKSSIIGIVVAVKDGTYYISDQSWRLNIIQSNFLISTPINDEKKTEK